MPLEELAELHVVHDISAIPIEGPHKRRILDGGDHICDALLTLLHLISEGAAELGDSLVASLDEVLDAQGVPIQGRQARTQALVQFQDLLPQQLLLHRRQVTHRRVVGVDQQVQLLHELLVLILLEGNVQNRVRQLEAAQLVQVLGLPNQELQLLREVHLVRSSARVLDQHVVLQARHGQLHGGGLPRFEEGLLILQDLLAQLHVLLAGLLSFWKLQQLRHRLEGKDGPLGAVEDAPSPQDGPGRGRRAL
mmetsp:Transcript_82349/g.197498  ORF Transcript_82349/g.197498 Transcript_82349/m.197498 type:complete len:250 (-) Transcript_82349:2167-2916(-)